MLNPDRERRLTDEKLLEASVDLGSFRGGISGDRWDVAEETFEKYSKQFNLTIESVVDEIEDKPYGQLGGTFNIEKHLHQLNGISLKQPEGVFDIRSLKVINLISSICHRKLARYVTESDIAQDDRH